MRYPFIAAQKANYPVTLMSRILKVSRSGFYAWHKRAESARARSDRALVIDIKAAHCASRDAYGSPRVHRELVAQGRTVGRDRVARCEPGAGVIHHTDCGRQHAANAYR